MNDVREATEELLADKPEAESALEEILAVDEGGPWTFDDLSIDSGTFGEIVSRGIAEKVDDGYRVTDQAAVSAAVTGDAMETGDTEESREWPTLSLPDVDRNASLALVGSLVFVALMRTVFMWPRVFRDGNVVLASNDPWGYRYYVEQILANDVAPFAFGTLTEYLGTGLAQDHLYVVVAWWFALVLGGTPHAAGLALAWLPVIAGVVSSMFVYLIAVRLTADRRVGLASVLLLAVTPAHAFRTALGFGDHHAFDYVFVAATAYALIVIADEYVVEADTDWRSLLSSSKATWAGICLLGVGIAGQSLAWRAGPLLYIPAAGYALYRAISDVRAGQSPLVGNVPLVLGLGLAAVLAVVPATLWGWEMRWVRVGAPALLLLGTFAVLLVGEIAFRSEWSLQVVTGSATGVGVIVATGMWATIPELSKTITDFLNYLSQTNQSGIAETTSLFNNAGIVGPLLILGFVFYVALPYGLMDTWRAYKEHRPVQVVATVYFLYFIVLSAVQLRFAGSLSVFASVFAGIGFIHLASVVDLTEGVAGKVQQQAASAKERVESLRIPEMRTIGYFVVLFLMVASLGFLQTPVKQSQIAVDDGTYQTAKWISSTVNDTDGEGYIFSPWSQNRVYNYYLDGNSESYGYARDNYEMFVRSRNVTRWYQNLSGRDTYIVTGEIETKKQNSLQTRVHEQYGSASNGSDGLSHYRTVYIGDEHTVTEVVPGATIIGVRNDSVVPLSTSKSINGTTFTYDRKAETNPYGLYSVTVPYTGQYTIEDEDEVNISTNDIQSGTRTVQHDREGIAHWPFDRSDGSVVYDRVGGHTGIVKDTTIVDGVNGSALEFDGQDDGIVIPDRNNINLNSSFTISLWLRGNLTEAESTYPTVLQYRNSNQRVGIWARSDTDFGVAIDGMSPERHKNFGIQTTEFKNWTQIVFVVDRASSESRLYSNGRLQSRKNITWTNNINSGGSLTIGYRPNQHAPIQIDEIKLYSRSLNSSEINERYSSGKS
ncbi:LamG-like jellyroll fold domain-containing protein [Haloarcula sediminis]|uniref:LamG-like jellyroll fold domain-containing protein n=1 Tax=Haloarcula sediminis TaxID=3111777 RepID=UPI002D7906D6|nr:LamG-like jellyroll fold domain-containing protein [Haloarcula sp. CK38]